MHLLTNDFTVCWSDWSIPLVSVTSNFAAATTHTIAANKAKVQIFIYKTEKYFQKWYRWRVLSYYLDFEELQLVVCNDKKLMNDCNIYSIQSFLY